MKKNIDIKSYHQKGFFKIENFWDKNLIDKFIKTFYDILRMQNRKINLKEDFLKLENIEQKIDSIIFNLNRTCPAAIDFANQMLRESLAGMNIMTNDKLVLYIKELLDCPVEMIKIHMDGILINIPSSKNRLYKYHSEAHYYPKRKNFINIWSPVIRNKNIENGSMGIIEKSHEKHWYFNEYQGFNNNSLNNSDYLVQLEVPDEDFEDLKKVDVTLEKDAILFFNKNLLHTSNVNLSDSPSYAMVIRAYDYRNDLTLSDNSGDLPYRHKERASLPTGYPGMKSG